MRRGSLIALGLLMIACGASAQPAVVGAAPAVLARAGSLSAWPTRADYQTIKTAVAARNHLLFHVNNWSEKAYGARLALETLLTVRLRAGSCASYVGELVGNLRDLSEAYPGEKWGPLIRTVRREPPLAHACRRPGAGWRLITV